MGLQAPLVLETGALARYPLSTKEVFSTRTNKFADFSRQTFAQLANPLSQWVINLQLLKDSEASDWKDLFEATQGAYAPFTFIDPWDNLLQYSEQQETSPWASVGGIAVTQASGAIVDPFGRFSQRPRLLTISNTGTALLEQTVNVLPGGTGNSRTAGLTLTASIYAYLTAGSLPFSLAINDGAGASSVTVTPTTSWQRFAVTRRSVSTNTSTNVTIELNNFSSTGGVYIFGVQLEAAGAMSDYKTTTSYCGFHPTCYFQTDEQDRQAVEFGVNTTQLVIEESN